MTHTFAESYVSIDLETAGLGYGILEVGALKIEHHRVAGEYQQLVRPKCAITYGAQRVHHITFEMVREQPPFEAIAAKLEDFIGDLIAFCTFYKSGDFLYHYNADGEADYYITTPQVEFSEVNKLRLIVKYETYIPIYFAGRYVSTAVVPVTVKLNLEQKF